MVHSIRKVSKETQNQNNFVPKELRKKKKPLSTPTTLSLPTLAKLQKIDRFGRPLSSKTESEFQKVMHDTKLSPIPSSGNKFAPQSESSRKASLKSGKGWLIFTFTYMLTLAVFVMVLMYPQLVPFFYAATILPFFLFRFVSYYILARHHFCLEVCYFINYAVLAYILVFPDNPELLISVFNLSQSVGIGSTIILKFRFVFSDIQTFINAYMHVMPAVTTFCIRFLIDNSKSDIKYSVSIITIDQLVDNVQYLFVLPFAGFFAHELVYNFWVWVVPHPRLREKKTYCNTFVKALSGGFGTRWVSLLSVFGKRRALWVYNFAQLVWAAIMLSATALLYFDFYACAIYLGVLTLSIVANAGSFYSYKLKKLNAAEQEAERQISIIKDKLNSKSSDPRTFEELLYGEETDDEADLEKDMESRKMERYGMYSKKVGQDEQASVGREHRNKMSNDRNKNKNKHSANAKGESVSSPDDNLTAEQNSYFAQQRRRDAMSSSRPTVY